MLTATVGPAHIILFEMSLTTELYCSNLGALQAMSEMKPSALPETQQTPA